MGTGRVLGVTGKWRFPAAGPAANDSTQQTPAVNPHRRFCEQHEFEKPNDERALALMDAAAVVRRGGLSTCSLAMPCLGVKDKGLDMGFTKKAEML